MRARLLELAVVAAIAAAAVGGVVVYQAIAGSPGGTTWTAQFTDARGLLPGNDVRVDGAIAGRVTSITLSKRGFALVRFQLSARRAAPRSDAVAAIEPADLLGDTYMSLSPGSAATPLHGQIGAGHTVNAPRLDEVLDALTPNVRDGLQTLLLDGGLALDQRGGDLARATVALRPALSATQAVLDELDTQNGSLARLVPVAERAAAQIDSRRADIGPLLDGLARTLQASAGEAGALDLGAAGLPATLRQVRSVAQRLQATARAATPLADRLEPATKPLGAAVAGMPALIGSVQDAAPALSTALIAARTALRTAAPGIGRLSTAFPVLRRQAPSISALLSELDAAAPGIAQGFFVDFPDQADESGKQPFDPFADPRRAYWRGAAVFSCEAFGVPVAPGCLSRALANLAKQPPPSRSEPATANRQAERQSKASTPPSGTAAADSPRPASSAPQAWTTTAHSTPAPASSPAVQTTQSAAGLLHFLLSP